jgi:hypothetical protein
LTRVLNFSKQTICEAKVQPPVSLQIWGFSSLLRKAKIGTTDKSFHTRLSIYPFIRSTSSRPLCRFFVSQPQGFAVRVAKWGLGPFRWSRPRRLDGIDYSYSPSRNSFSSSSPKNPYATGSLYQVANSESRYKTSSD